MSIIMLEDNFRIPGLDTALIVVKNVSAHDDERFLELEPLYSYL